MTPLPKTVVVVYLLNRVLKVWVGLDSVNTRDEATEYIRREKERDKVHCDRYRYKLGVYQLTGMKKRREKV